MLDVRSSERFNFLISFFTSLWLFMGTRICVLEVDGHVALLQKISAYTVQERSKVATIEICERSWIQKSITLPVCWGLKDFFFHNAGGSYQMILEILDWHNEQLFTESLYSYDWKSNTFKEIIFSGIRNSVHEEGPTNLFTAFSENLVSLSPAEKEGQHFIFNYN